LAAVTVNGRLCYRRRMSRRSAHLVLHSLLIGCQSRSAGL